MGTTAVESYCNVPISYYRIVKPLFYSLNFKHIVDLAAPARTSSFSPGINDVHVGWLTVVVSPILYATGH